MNSGGDVSWQPKGRCQRVAAVLVGKPIAWRAHRRTHLVAEIGASLGLPGLASQICPN